MLTLANELTQARDLLLAHGFTRAALRLQLKGKARKKPRYQVVHVGAKASPSTAFRVESDRIAVTDGGLEQNGRSS